MPSTNSVKVSTAPSIDPTTLKVRVNQNPTYTPKEEPPTIDMAAIYADPEFNQKSLAQQRETLANIDPNFSKFTDMDYFEHRSRTKWPIDDSKKPPVPTFLDKVIDNARGLVAGGFNAAGIMGGTPVSRLAGVGASVASDMALQSAMSVPPSSMVTSALGLGPRTPEASLANTAEMLISNEVGGKVLEKPLKALKSLYMESSIPGLISGPLSHLNATYSMYKLQTLGDRPISQFVENVFAAVTKVRQQEESQSLGYAEGLKLAAKTSGRAATSAANPDWMASQIKLDIENGLSQAYKASRDRAKIAINMAKVNTAAVLSEGPPDLTVPGNPHLPPAQNPLSGRFQQGARLVEGPIPTNNTAQKAQEYLLGRQKIYGDLSKAAPQDQPMIALAQKILSTTNAKIDPATGIVMKSEPLGFEEAWDIKQVIGKEAFRNYDPSAATQKSNNLRDFYNSLDKDIEAGMAQWPNDPKKTALKAYREAKAIVDIRHRTFGKAGLNNILKTNDSPIPDIDGILKDPERLQRAMSVGKIFVGGKVVSSSNLRSDLAGYKVSTIFHNSYVPDAINPAVGKIDPVALTKEWNSPYFQTTKNKLFNAQTRGNIDQLLKNVARTAVNPPGEFSSSRLMPVRAGLLLAPGLITGAITNSTLYGAGMMGVVLSGHAVAKLMAGPNARKLIALSAGQPLEMSEQAFARVLVGSLQGESVGFMGKGGNIKKGVINAKGEFVPEEE
jgi:hypothetical protein